MTETWIFTYNRHTHEVAQEGLTSRQDAYTTKDSTVHICVESKLTICRKRFTYSPAFFSVNNDWIVVSSHYLLLLSELRKKGSPIDIDPEYAIDYLSFQCPWTHKTLCKQIETIRNGEEIVIERNSEAIRHLYPFLVNNTSTPNIESYLKHELSALEAQEIAFHISSGLDSSLLVILASKMPSLGSIRAVTCQTLGSGATDELDIVKRLCREHGVQLDIFDFRDTNVFESGEDFVRDCVGYPIAHPSHILEFLLDKRLSASCSIAVSGRGPDECLAGYSWHRSPFADRKLFLDRLRVTTQDIIDSLFKPHTRTKMEGFPANLLSHSNEKLSVHDRLSLDQRGIADAWAIVHSGVELGLNIRIAKPYQNSELTEALFNLDEHKMINSADQKIYLRETMSHHYPAYLLSVPKQGFRLDVKPYLQKYPGVLDTILDSEFTYRYLNKQAIIKMHENTLKGTKNFGWQLWSLFLLSQSATLIFN